MPPVIRHEQNWEFLGKLRPLWHFSSTYGDSWNTDSKVFTCVLEGKLEIFFLCTKEEDD